MVVDYIKMINDQEAIFSDLFTRMDKDRDFLNQKDFTLFDKDDREAPDIENVTMNDAVVFADFVQSVLNRAGIQHEVTGEKLKDNETAFVEDFFREYLRAVDEDISRRDIHSFYAWNIQQACFRGRIAARVTVGMDGDKFDPGVLPLDARFMVYDIGRNGLKWVAPKFNRSKAQITDEYGEEIGGKVRGSSAIVKTLWILDNKVKEIVFIGTEQVRELEFPEYSELPFIIQVCPAGLMLQEDDQVSRNGESIFYMARNLFTLKSKMVSIMDTVNMLSIFGGLQKEVEDEERAKKPEHPPYGKRFVVPVQKGTKGYFSMPLTDIRVATRLEYSIVDQAIQDATLPRVSFGTLQAPTSGVGIAQLKQVEEKVFKVRTQALEVFYQRLLQMVKEQFVNKNMNIKLGQPGFIKTYSSKELEKDIAITSKISITSRMEDMANISMVAALGGLFSDDTKLREYLHVNNPEEETRKKWAELASKVSPVIAKYEIAKALAEQGEKIKARLMAEEMGLTLEQLLGGQIDQQPNEIKPEKPKQIVSMFGGGQGGGTPRSEELMMEEQNAT